MTESSELDYIATRHVCKTFSARLELSAVGWCSSLSDFMLRIENILAPVPKEHHDEVVVFCCSERGYIEFEHYRYETDEQMAERIRAEGNHYGAVLRVAAPAPAIDAQEFIGLKVLEV
jgi:hypothetical protein